LPARGLSDSGWAKCTLHERDWSTIGLSASGSPSARVLSKCGSSVVPSVVQVWSKCGPSVVQVWSKCAPSVLQVCSKCAPSVLQVCAKCAPSVLQVCSKCDPTALGQLLHGFKGSPRNMTARKYTTRESNPGPYLLKSSALALQPQPRYCAYLSSWHSSGLRVIQV
jgi:hypothetical protein